MISKLNNYWQNPVIAVVCTALIFSQFGCRQGASKSPREDFTTSPKKNPISTKPAQTNKRDSQGRDSEIQVYPTGQGGGVVSIDPHFLQAIKKEDSNEKLESAKKQPAGDSTATMTTLPAKPQSQASSLGKHEQIAIFSSILAVGIGAALGVGVYKYKTKSKAIKNTKLEIHQADDDSLLTKARGSILETGKFEGTKKTKIAQFKRKQLENLENYVNNPSYGFTTIKFPKKDSYEGEIILGILGDDDLLKKAGSINNKKLSVLSAVEDFELETAFRYLEKHSDGKVVEKTFKRFNEKNLSGAWKHISTPDYRPVKGDLIDQGADFIAKEIDRGRNVYVHCKSGKGRSATMVAAYLIKYRGMGSEEAIQTIYGQRGVVSIAKAGIFGGHRKAIEAYADSIKKGLINRYIVEPF